MIQYNEYEKEVEVKKAVELKKHQILCSECGKLLGNLIDTGEPINTRLMEKPHIYQCYCPCGHECFPVRLENNASVFTNEGYALVDMVSERKITHIKIGRFK